MAAESDFQRLLNLRRAGVDPNLIRAFGPGGAEMLSGAGERVQNLAGQAQQAVGELNTPAGRGKMRAATNLAGTALGVLPGAIQTTQQQGLLPGITSGAAGLATGAAVAPISNLLMRSGNPLAKVAGFGLQALAPAAVQAGTAGMFGAAEEGKKGSGGADVAIPATPITPEVPLSDAARQRIQQERDLATELKRMQTLGPAQLGLDRQAMQDQVNAYVQLQKSLQPLAERTMRQQLINQQALINTQTGAYQQLGRQAGMFKLAGQGMAEAGATLRTAISQNPYAGSTIQAPSISFG